MSLTTSTITRDGTAYILPPQTTPFSFHWTSAPADNPCSSASIYCQFVVGQDPKPMNELVCTQGFATTLSSTVGFDRWQGQCFPPNFFEVFQEDFDADPEYPPDKDLTSAAYPGSACIHDWTTACTKQITVTASGAAATTSRQAWCCAPGYSCTTASADADATAERHCYSFLTAPTAVWASWDPATTLSDGGEYYTYPTSIDWQPPKDKYTVFHRPLPLAVSAWIGEEGEENKPEGMVTRTAAPGATGSAK